MAHIASYATRIRAILTDSDHMRRVALNLFWFLVLVSWLPVIAGFTGFADNFIPFRGGPPDAVRWLAVPVPHVFAMLALVIAALALYLKQPLLLICAVAPLLANFLGAPGVPGERNAAYYVAIAYLAAFAVSFVLFAIRGHLRSLPVLLFVLICGWDTAVHELLEFWAWLKSWFIWAADVSLPDLHTETVLHYVLTDYSAAESDLLIFLACLVFARFLALVWQQNVELGRRLKKYGWKDLASKYLWPAFLLWWPMLAVFVLFGVWAYPALTNHISQQVALAIQDDLIEKKYDEAKGQNPQLEEMIRHLIKYNRRELVTETKSKIDGLNLAAVKTTHELNTTVYKKLATDIFPDRMPGTRTKGCRKTSIPCHAGNGVKSLANSGYRRLRDPPLAATKQTLVRLHEEAKGNGTLFAQNAKAAIENEINKSAAQAGVAFEKVLYAMSMFSLIMLIYSIMVLVKTYGIVLARIIFDIKNTRRFYARLSNEDTNPGHPSRPIQSEVRHIEKQPLALLRSEKLNYYLTRDVLLPAGLPSAYVPYPAKAIGRRLRTKRYLMSYVDIVHGQFSNVSLHLPGVFELVRWDIADGEQVVFRFKDLVGMSVGIRLKTEITFSLQALVFGRSVFHTATGKGILLLRTTRYPVVGAGTTAEEGPRKARDAGSLISWHTRTPFEIQSDRTIRGVFWLGYNIEKQAQGRVVYTTDATDSSSALMGIARWIRTFMSPI